MSCVEIWCEHTEGKASGMSLIFVLSVGKRTRSLNKKLIELVVTFSWQVLTEMLLGTKVSVMIITDCDLANRSGTAI